MKVQNFFSHKVHNFASEENGKSSTRNSKTSLDLSLLKKTVVVELLKRMKGESELFLRKKKKEDHHYFIKHIYGCFVISEDLIPILAVAS